MEATLCTTWSRERHRCRHSRHRASPRRHFYSMMMMRSSLRRLSLSTKKRAFINVECEERDFQFSLNTIHSKGRGKITHLTHIYIYIVTFRPSKRRKVVRERDHFFARRRCSTTTTTTTTCRFCGRAKRTSFAWRPSDGTCPRTRLFSIA